MNSRRMLSCVLTLLLPAAGCPGPMHPDGPSNAASRAEACPAGNGQRPSNGHASPGDGEVATSNTGDSDFWPRVDLPLVIEEPVPEVPPGIGEPAAPLPDRDE